MNYLTAIGLKKLVGHRELFNEISFGINKGDRVALVAKNGTGKTTLLGLVAGEDDVDGGEIRKMRGLRIGYLFQDTKFDEDKEILDVLFDSESEVIKATREYEAALENYEDADRLSKAMEKMDALDAWTYEAKVKKVLSILRIDHLQQKVGSLSGGQKKRLALAQVLLSEPDLLILDEPTNHLDLEMIDWLEDFLMKSNLTFLMVTHDRYFLERACDRIFELDKGDLYCHDGNYSFYLQQKLAREERKRREIQEARNLYRQELEWIRTQPRARESKSKSRIEAFDDIEAMAKQRMPKQQVQLEVKSERLGTKVLEVHNLCKAYEGKVMVSGFSYRFDRGGRIGIVGKNGVGKSTFLKLIVGEEEADAGTVKVGETVVFGYFSQAGIEVKPMTRIIDAVRKVAEYIQLKGGRKVSAAQMLERFLFDRDKQHQSVNTLSGGEKRRLGLLMVLMKNPNFLILDEPTNDLDILTLNVLEEFLMEFAGCIVLVTHDRYFMDKLVDELFVFEGDGVITRFPGTYSEYRALSKAKEDMKKAEAKMLQAAKVQAKVKPEKSEEKKRLSYNEQREFDQLEKEMPLLEAMKAELNQKLMSGDLGHEEMREVADELGKLTDDLNVKTERWLELAERA